MIIAQYMDVILRNFEESDVLKKVEWINNPENNQFLHYDLPLRIDRTIEWFRNKDNSRRIDCIIEYNKIPVGLIGLLQIDRFNSKAEYYITIGENRFKQKGIATKATKAIIEYAFTELKLHKVYLTVDARNEHAIHLYEKSGFKREGYFVDDLFCTSSYTFIARAKYAALNNFGGLKLYYTIENPLQKRLFCESKEDATPIQNVGVIEDNLLFIKRDDMIPYSFGGNKARKGKLFFNEIDVGDYDCVVTYGSSHSNHCRIIANMAAARGMKCYVIGPTEVSDKTFNSRFVALFGTEVTTVPVEQVHNTIENMLKELRDTGHNPYFIPGGGHGNIGTEAYVQCYDEIKEYEQKHGIYFDYIFFASGTGTTQAGLVCGQIKNHDERNIIGISIARKNPRGRDVVIESIREYLVDYSEEAIQRLTIFIDKYTGNGYGKNDEAVIDTLKEAMIQYGIPLDSTYTGKAFFGMKQYLNENHIEGKKILFIHTGGTPLFFDDLKNLER